MVTSSSDLRQLALEIAATAKGADEMTVEQLIVEASKIVVFVEHGTFKTPLDEHFLPLHTLYGGAE